MSDIGDIASILTLSRGNSLPRKGDNPVLEALIDGALKKSQEPGFFSREAGQNRRAWLDETVNYFTPPELRGPLGLLNEANPVTSMERASTASQTMLAPETSGWGRVAAGGDMLSNMAGVVAPAMVASKAGLPAVNAIEEGLLGWAPGMPAAAGNFMADEFGGLRLYHGSPHDFDKFSMDKIGTGEGAQAYGHGLYFADNPAVAKNYRDTLSKSGTDGAQRRLETAGGDIDAAIAQATEKAAKYRAGGADSYASAVEEDLRFLKKFKETGEWTPGRMYEVDVNANPEDFLDWDAPLSAQPQDVQWLAKDNKANLAARGVFLDDTTPGGHVVQALKPEEYQGYNIPGIKYLDAGSRTAGEGSRNYVVFDENLINIVKKYGVAGAATMLGVTQADVAQAMEGQQ